MAVKIKTKIKENAPEILLLAGFFVGILTTYTIDIIKGLYMTAAFLIGLGIFLARMPPKRGK